VIVASYLVCALALLVSILNLLVSRRKRLALELREARVAALLPEDTDRATDASRVYRESNGVGVDQGLGARSKPLEACLARATRPTRPRWWWSRERAWDWLEGDETVLTLDRPVSQCPQCSKHQQYTADFAEWAPRSTGSEGPTRCRSRTTPGPVRTTRSMTLQRCVNCEAIWRVRLTNGVVQ